MNSQKADFEWYSQKSSESKSEPRCPLASVELCPRYYLSLEELGKHGISTEIPTDGKVRLNKKWKQFKPIIAEEEPAITRSDGRILTISKLCPEIGYEVFNHFADTFCEYSNEMDRENSHTLLAKSDASRKDPRWRWGAIRPRHYTECREYSVFREFTQKKPRTQTSRRQGLPSKLRWQILARDSFTCVYCGSKPPFAVLEVDHKISVADGGTNDAENLVTGCLDCNRGKGAESVAK